jgi:hypothetical protein
MFVPEPTSSLISLAQGTFLDPARRPAWLARSRRGLGGAAAASNCVPAVMPLPGVSRAPWKASGEMAIAAHPHAGELAASQSSAR